MNKLLVILTLVVLVTGSLWSDSASVTVQNQELWQFWYVLDPQGFEGEAPGSSWLGPKVAAYLAKDGEEFPFIALAPAETVTFTELAEGTHYLLGFFEDDSLAELPVRLITLQADASMGTRHYDVYSLPELMMAVRGQGLLERFAPSTEVVTATEAAPVEETAAAEEPPVEEVTEEVPEEPAAEVVAAEETVVEEVLEEPVAEEPAVEEVAEEVPEEPAAEVVATEETVVEEVSEEPMSEEPAVDEVVVEEVIEEPAVEVVATEEAVVEEVIEEPVAEVVATEETVVEEQVAEPEAETLAVVADEPAGAGDLATFADSYDPVYFTRESRDGFTVLPIASSRAWGRPGTRLSAFTGSLADGTLSIVLRSPDGFAENVSYFFYVFPARSAGGASEYTFEARPDVDGRAAVVLWQKGRAVPRLVGTAFTDGDEFTWTARADELPPELAQALGPAATLDLTTAWLDETSGTWEEFYFTTFAVADLTR